GNCPSLCPARAAAVSERSILLEGENHVETGWSALLGCSVAPSRHSCSDRDGPGRHPGEQLVSYRAGARNRLEQGPSRVVERARDGGSHEPGTELRPLDRHGGRGRLAL